MTTHAASALEDWRRSLDRELAALEAGGLRRTRRTFTPLQDGRLRSGDRVLVNLAGNDYLGLSHHPRVIEAARRGLEETVGSRASGLVSGRSPWHESLERTIAAFEGCEDALVFPTGVAANVGTSTALMGEGDIVFCDRLNHASLVDGCRQSGARLRIYRHDDLETLSRELRKPFDGGRRWIVTDGVFSMDGDIAPLPELCDLAEAYDALIIVDEAHGTGVFGETGRGVCEHFEVEDRVALRIGTLSKAVGCLGGFVAGSHALCELLLNRARTQIYSTSLPPALCAAASVALEIIGNEPPRRNRLWRRVDETRRLLLSAGLIDANCFRSPIIPIVLGEPGPVMGASARLEAARFLVAGIRPPTVPRGTSRLRLSLHSELAESEVTLLVEAMGAAIAAERIKSRA